MTSRGVLVVAKSYRKKITLIIINFNGINAIFGDVAIGLFILMMMWRRGCIRASILTSALIYLFYLSALRYGSIP